MKKYLISKQSIWVAKKAGCKTGYGKTPKKAFQDAAKTKTADRVRSELTHFYDARMLALQNQIANLKTENARLSKLAVDGTEEGWLIMAMLYLGTNDARKAENYMIQTHNSLPTNEKAFQKLETYSRLWEAQNVVKGALAGE
jgi:hypothetical protein